MGAEGVRNALSHDANRLGKKPWDQGVATVIGHGARAGALWGHAIERTLDSP